MSCASSARERRGKGKEGKNVEAQKGPAKETGLQLGGASTGLRGIRPAESDGALMLVGSGWFGERQSG
jgi:hypothetical protein